MEHQAELSGLMCPLCNGCPLELTAYHKAPPVCVGGPCCSVVSMLRSRRSTRPKLLAWVLSLLQTQPGTAGSAAGSSKRLVPALLLSHEARGTHPPGCLLDKDPTVVKLAARVLREILRLDPRAQAIVEDGFAQLSATQRDGLPRQAYKDEQ